MQVPTDTYTLLDSIRNEINLPLGSRIAVGMSGGVDSSVVAAVLHQLGYDVVGLTLRLYDSPHAPRKAGACCAGTDIYDAKSVADSLGFPHYVLDMQSAFRTAVVDEFADSYLRGETPIPCVRCNQSVKFTDLLGFAKDVGAEALATGHYVRRMNAATPALLRGVDMSKDQSYFLFATTAAQLDYLRFPLGGLTKDQTRALAHFFEVPTAAKPESMDICFVPDGKYAEIVTKLRPEGLNHGNIVMQDGEIVGTHQGIIHYTIGQRRGLGIGGRKDSTDPLFVIALRPDTHEVVVGPREALAIRTVTISEQNWLSPLAVEHIGDVPVQVKYRSAMQPVAAKLRSAGKDQQHIVFQHPQYGVAKGQAAVCYHENTVLGGGFIAHTSVH